MIPQLNVTAWSQHAPWPEPRQVEQDLIIARALVDIFTDESLREALRFRGGTALNKLHFPRPLRYSEDIDLVRTAHGPIGPILDRLRALLEPWLGQAAFAQSEVAPKFRFRVPSEDNPDVHIRLKLEINTHETEAYDEPLNLPLVVENPWFSGEVEIPTFSHEEMLATKLRALLQRQKGRDLFDLAHAVEVFAELDHQHVVDVFVRYLDKGGLKIRRAEAEQRMFGKLARPAFMQDMRPLLPPDAAAALSDAANRTAFTSVFRSFVWRLDGPPWEKTPEYAERFDVPSVVQET